MTLPKKGLKKYDYNIDMDREYLEKLDKSELIELLLNKNNDVDAISRYEAKPSVTNIIKRYEAKPHIRYEARPHRIYKAKPNYIVNRMIQLFEGKPRPPKPTRAPPKPPIAMNRSPKPDREPPLPPIKEVDDKPVSIINRLSKALNGCIKSYYVTIQHKFDVLEHFKNTRPQIDILLENLLKDTKGFKFFETIVIRFIKQSVSGDVNNLHFDYQTKTANFNSKAKIITNDVDIEHNINTSREYLKEKISKWLSEGSGFTIDEIESHYINIAKYKPLKGSSYIGLPKELRNPKKKLINIKNEDNECFRWCHIRHLNPINKNPQRINKMDKEMINQLNYNGIDFPVSSKHYNKIEKQNDIKINVFGYEEKQTYPIYVSKETYEDQMNVLLITEEEKKHYVLIKDFDSFMYNQTKHKARKHFCMYCLQCFSSDVILGNHVKNCIEVNGMQAIKMPNKNNNILKFNNFHKQQKVPFVIYADFEAITEKIQGCQPSNDSSYTDAYQKHTDCGYGYKLVCCYDDKYTKPVQIYRGEKAVYKFMEKMLEEVEYCKTIMRKEFNKPLVMTENEELSFKLENKCHICEKSYNEEDIRVRDHCHITGNYRGSSHQDCNLKLRIDPREIKIPVIFHNLRGYDSHLIMQEIGEIVKQNTYIDNKGEERHMNINAIPNNMEKYMAFMLGNHLTFLDSFQFMSSSLDKLVSNLPRDSFKYTSNEFKGKRLNLILQKGVYPYDYMDCFEKFDQTELPTKDQFYSILNDQHITDEEYNHAMKVWKSFKIKTMGEYHNLYLGSDVLLLADVFENFRKTCLEYYKLDPVHYFTSPGLSWDAMLKMTNIKLELMTDIDMFQFIEKGMKGEYLTFPIDMERQTTST